VRYAFLTLFFGVLAMLYFQLLIWISQVRIEIQYGKDPPGVNCQTLLHNGGSDADTLAYLELKQYKKHYRNGMRDVFTGNM